jgi:hypothetical protein
LKVGILVKVLVLVLDNVPDVDVLGFEKLIALGDGSGYGFVREQLLAKVLKVLQLVEVLVKL